MARTPLLTSLLVAGGAAVSLSVEYVLQEHEEGGPMMTSFRVVVIEDDASISELIDETLADEGYEVFRVPRGRGAAAVVAATRPHLVLLDRHLGDCDATHVLADLRAHPSLAHIPIVLMSASATVYAEAAELAVTGVLAKPFLLDALVACVATFMLQAPLERSAGA